jgi:hypothetical protein
MVARQPVIRRYLAGCMPLNLNVPSAFGTSGWLEGPRFHVLQRHPRRGTALRGGTGPRAVVFELDPAGDVEGRDHAQLEVIQVLCGGFQLKWGPTGRTGRGSGDRLSRGGIHGDPTERRILGTQAGAEEEHGADSHGMTIASGGGIGKPTPGRPKTLIE